MPPLSDLQHQVRDALVLDRFEQLESVLVGGRHPRMRLAIHQRHYRASLVNALLDRFPATVWLVGSDFIAAAAARFVQQHPPTRPCIAEYGDLFPAFLGLQVAARDIGYLEQFAELEWHIGRLSVAVDVPPVSTAELSVIDGEALTDASVSLQPDVHYMRADWAIDELISLYLRGDAPDQFSLEPCDLRLELRGARGELHINRLTHADFVFRATLARGTSLGAAAISALDVDEAFDAGQAMLRVFQDGLVVGIHMDGAA